MTTQNSPSPVVWQCRVSKLIGRIPHHVPSSEVRVERFAETRVLTKENIESLTGLHIDGVTREPTHTIYRRSLECCWNTLAGRSSGWVQCAIRIRQTVTVIVVFTYGKGKARIKHQTAFIAIVLYFDYAGITCESS